MIKHIVIWTLHDEAEGCSKAENAKKAKVLLESLNGKIPGLINLEVGIDLIGDGNCGDVCLYSELETADDLPAYATHPEHVKCIPFMQAIASSRSAMDYQV